MKKILIIFLLPFAILYAQDDKSNNPNVELPDFVITGKDVVSIKRAKKIEPEFVPIVTQKFLKPHHKPEELGLRELSHPLNSELNLLDSTNNFRGIISAKAGIYTLPYGKIGYAYPFTNGMVEFNIGALNQREYIDNSGRYSVFGGAGVSYTIGLEDEAVSGTKFYLNGNYSSTNYKLFASENPADERTKNSGNYNFGVQNLSGRNFIFDLNLKNNATSLSNSSFNENLLRFNGYGFIQFADVGVGVKSNYQSQFFTNDSLSNKNFSFFFIRPYVSFKLFNTIFTEAGYSFTNSGGQSFNKIYVSGKLKFSNNLILMGEFSPQAEFLTSGTLLRRNDYFTAKTFTNLFVRKSNYFDVSLKYEYEKYYQISGGLIHYKSGNLPYFTDGDLSGQFKLNTSDAEEYNAYLNLLYNTGPYGFFYGSFNYFKVTDKNSRKLPYYPSLKAALTYGYNFDIGLLTEITANYSSDRYTNIENTNKLGSFFNLGLKFTYTLQNTFLLKLEFQNLLDKDIFYWNGYKEKPLDVVIGINYLFN